MPLRASAVGATYTPRDTTISTRTLLSFAAGLHIGWPSLMDDAQQGGIVGFPTYCGALEFNAFSASSGSINPIGYTPEEMHRAASSLAEVSATYTTAGDEDVIALVHATSLDHLRDVIAKLRSASSITSTRTHVVLDAHVKSDWHPPTV